MANSSFLGNLWDRAEAALGPIAQFIPAIAANIKVNLASGDVTAIKARVVELQEAAAALGGLASHLEVVIADGSVSLDETAAIALKLENFIDQIEDVAKGYDEDKLKSLAPAPDAGKKTGK